MKYTPIKTPYEYHQELKHRTTFVSHNGIDKVEECTQCPAKFLFHHADSYATTLYAQLNKKVSKPSALKAAGVSL